MQKESEVIDMRKHKMYIAAITLAVCMMATACGGSSGSSDSLSSNNNNETVSSSDSSSNTNSSDGNNSSSTGNSSSENTSGSSSSSNSSGILDTSDIFSNRDLEQTADVSDAETINIADGQIIDITTEGVYLISGSAKNCTIRVAADTQDKVQLVLDGVNITNDDFPAIYVVSADKCFITTTGSDNTLSVTGTFTSDGDTNTDAVIFSKDDLVLNGTGTLEINSTSGNGISAKDDLKITGGTYTITSAKDSIEANDSISICGGTFNITSSKDALHCENDDDNTLGWIYISDGTFNITATSDGIQGTTVVQIDGGTFHIISSEGIEATYVQINGGTIYIEASDDGINASANTSIYDVVIEINGGDITVVMGQGDTDAIDANGSIYVNGGTIDITATMSSFDYDRTAEFNGGTIIINGEEVSEIPAGMMGGGFGDKGGDFNGGGNHGKR